MKKYTKPELTIEEILMDDVICTSPIDKDFDIFGEDDDTTINDWFNA